MARLVCICAERRRWRFGSVKPSLAAEVPVELGYTNIKEFGGIIDWPYETE